MKIKKNMKLIANIFIFFFILNIVNTETVSANAGLKLGILKLEDIKKNIMTVEQLESAQILNVEIRDINNTSVSIYWQTDTYSTVNLNYGQTIPPIENIIHLTKNTEHTIDIDNLEPGSRYYFSIKGNPEYRGQFNTTGIAWPKLIKINNNSIEKNAVDLELNFNIPVKGKITYWIFSNETDKKTKEYSEYSEMLNFKSEDLLPNAVYYYVFEGNDSLEREIKTDRLSFTTKENNIALNKKVTGTFTVKLNDMRGDSETILNRIVDNSTNYFDGIATSESLAETDQYLIIDFEDIYKIKLIIAHWRKLSYSTEYKIELSVDGENWELLQSDINAAKGFSQPSDSGDPMLLMMTSGRGKSGRYLKLTCSRGKYWVKHSNWTFVQLNELKVFPE